ncbi:MAG: hypothetical protein J6Z27_00890 [Bacteroidales bacterium]|nr:hypothetical protein [Bacteroidales bacterium]
MNQKVRDTVISYTVATFGLLLVAIGVAWSIISNLGTSALSCPSYVLVGIGGLTVGNWTILINTFYMLVQLAVLRRQFKWKYLMQIPASLVFGYLIDFSLYCFSWLHPTTFSYRLILNVLSCVISALGISIEVVARAWMLSAEMTVYAFTKTIHKPFGNIKVVMDSLLVVVASVLAFSLFRNPFGFGEYTGLAGILTGETEGVVIGIGTLLSAVLIGWMMRFTDPVANKLIDAVISRFVYNKS